MPNTQVLRLEQRLVRGLSMLSGRGHTQTETHAERTGSWENMQKQTFKSFHFIHAAFLIHMRLLFHATSGKSQITQLHAFIHAPTPPPFPPSPCQRRSRHISHTHRTNRNQSLPTVMQLHFIDIIVHIYSLIRCFFLLTCPAGTSRLIHAGEGRDRELTSKKIYFYSFN